jgi:hypothetical protein
MNPVFRFENKFCCTLRDIDSVYSWICRSPHFIRKQFPDRNVNNIYFDWFNLSDASDNLIGLGRREKLRLRWYGPAESRASMRLERKIKRDLLGAKQILEVGELQLRGMSRTALAQALVNAHERPTAADLRLRNPTVRNRYLREYFIDAEERIRITVDSRQAFFGVESAGDVLRGNRIDYPVYVIELKYDERDQFRVRDFMHGFPLRPVRHSKYLAGLSRIVEQPYY